MLARSFMAAGLIAAPLSVGAAERLGYYYTHIGQADLRNSSGARLTEAGAILQQDRANYHRFGKPDLNDESDPVFEDQGERSRIPQLYQRGPNEAWVDDLVQSADPNGLLIVICGRGGRPTHLIVSGADGDSIPDCR